MTTSFCWLSDGVATALRKLQQQMHSSIDTTSLIWAIFEEYLQLRRDKASTVI